MTYANPENLTGFIDMFQYSNTVTGGIFGPGFLVALFLIVLLYMKNNGEGLEASMMVAGLLTTVIGALFFFMDIISGAQLFLCILIMAVATIWQWVKADS